MRVVNVHQVKTIVLAKAGEPRARLTAGALSLCADSPRRN